MEEIKEENIAQEPKKESGLDIKNMSEKECKKLLKALLTENEELKQDVEKYKEMSEMTEIPASFVEGKVFL